VVVGGGRGVAVRKVCAGFLVEGRMEEGVDIGLDPALVGGEELAVSKDVHVFAVDGSDAAVEPPVFFAVEQNVLADGNVRHRGARVGEGTLEASPHGVGLQGGGGGLGGVGPGGARHVPVGVVPDKQAGPLAKDSGRG